MANDWQGVEEIDAADLLASRQAAPGQVPRQRLRITHLTPEQMDALVESPHLAPVTHLDLSRNRIGHYGTQNLLWRGQLGQLTHLDLSGNRTLNTLDELGQSTITLRGLEDLRLADNAMDWTMMEYLALVEFDRLGNLNVRGNRIGLEGVRQLVASQHFAPEMTIAVDGFQGRFDQFQKWVRGLRPGRGTARSL